jgi:aspartyl-tRNA(Asn)/glutamyl-tRNA(Gln) amidotransferase subunit B
LMLDAKWIDQTRKNLPELPDQRKARLAGEYSLAALEVDQLTVHPALAEYYEAVARASGDGKAAYNWVMGEVQAALRASGEDIARFRVRPADLAQLLNLVRGETISHTAAKRVFARMVETGKPAAQIAADEGLLQVGDRDALASWVDEVLAEHPEEAKRFLGGEKKLQGVLVGLVMKKSSGRADPKRVNQLLATLAE